MIKEFGILYVELKEAKFQTKWDFLFIKEMVTDVAYVDEPKNMTIWKLIT